MPDESALDAITKLEVEGFKSLAQPTEIEIRPLTLLAGANSSGKSSALQPLLLLKQTLEAQFDPGPLLLDGPNVSFTSVDQMLSQINRGHAHEMCLRVGITSPRSNLTMTFQKQDQLEVAGCNFNQFGKKDGGVEMSPNMKKEEVLELAPIDTQSIFSEADNYEAKIIRNRFFLEARVEKGEIIRGGVTGLSFPPSRYAYEKYLIESVIHVPGLRGNPSRTHRTTAVGGRFPGTFDTYVASVIHAWQREEDARMGRLVDQLKHLGLTGDVAAERVNDTQVELRVAQQPIGSEAEARMINIADVGLGVSQVLPVLVACLVAEEGQLVYVEQPEIHLHPRAQARLADVLADAANRGVRVVVETHSQLLLLAIQTRIAEEKLDPEDVMLHWFTRNPETGITDVDSRHPDEKGAFGDWPEDFSEVEMEWQSRFLDATEKHLFNS